MLQVNTFWKNKNNLLKDYVTGGGSKSAKGTGHDKLTGNPTSVEAAKPLRPQNHPPDKDALSKRPYFHIFLFK